jgi:regulator of replication initiation timing
MTQELLLSEFPQQLADLAQQLHEADKVIRQRQQQLDTLTAEIEQAIAGDRDLKNEQQRKAKRLELTTSTAYQQAQAALQTAQDERHQLHIQYRLIADRFTVAKLITRERIASLELAA